MIVLKIEEYFCKRYHNCYTAFFLKEVLRFQLTLSMSESQREISGNKIVRRMSGLLKKLFLRKYTTIINCGKQNIGIYNIFNT